MEVFWSSVIGVMKGETRSLDNGSCRFCGCRMCLFSDFRVLASQVSLRYKIYLLSSGGEDIGQIYLQGINKIGS